MLMDWYLKKELMLGISKIKHRAVIWVVFFQKLTQRGWAEPKKELRHHKGTNASS